MFTGGEPLARTDLTELVSAARTAGLYTNLITSGIGLNDQRLAALVDAGLDAPAPGELGGCGRCHGRGLYVASGGATLADFADDERRNMVLTLERNTRDSSAVGSNEKLNTTTTSTSGRASVRDQPGARDRLLSSPVRTRHHVRVITATVDSRKGRG